MCIDQKDNGGMQRPCSDLHDAHAELSGLVLDLLQLQHLRLDHSNT